MPGSDLHLADQPFRIRPTFLGTKIKNGRYFPYLEPRLERYCERLSPGSSFVFFYLNYDNPVSAHEYKYALVGCARLSSLGLTGHFPSRRGSWTAYEAAAR